MSSDSESEVDDSEDVIHRLHATRRPFILACCVELLFCFMLTSWMSEGNHYTVFFRLRKETIGSQSVVLFVWVVFGVSVFFRLWCLGCLGDRAKERILARKSGRKLTVGYMFFGTVNWLLYLTAYYVAHDASSKIVRSDTVNIDLKRGDPMTERMKLCLLANSWNYLKCNMHLETGCIRPYDGESVYANGDCVTTVQVDGVSCCISETLKIERPLFAVFGKEVGVCMEFVFMLIQWMSILLVGWVLRHGFFAAGVGTGDFSKTAYLEILDAVIFSENLKEDLVRCPGYGISRTGRPQEKNMWPYYFVYLTFATAFATVLLSQMLYTLFVPKVEEAEDPEESEESEENDSGEVVLISVDSEVNMAEHHGSWRTGQVLERGSSPGIYRIRFVDGEPSEAFVSIDGLTAPNADITIHHLHEKIKDAAHQGCSGWLVTRNVCKGTYAARFEKKAQMLDTLRSLLCLNLPFLVWRLYFDAFEVDMLAFASRGLLIAKNAIWAVYDLVKLLACLNKDAKFFGFKPMHAFSLVTTTKFGKLWVGPTGMVAMLAEFAGILRRKKMQKHEHRLQKYKDWLVAERKGCDGNLKEVYDGKLMDVQAELVVAHEKMQFDFP